MIDLHSHTSASDGTLPPEDLVALACAIGLEGLAITDHDTFAGYDQARLHADQWGLDLICGIELSTRFRNRSVHLLGYFLAGKPGPEFSDWILGLQHSRLTRNHELAENLKSHGIEIPMDRLRERHGGMLGRPHFAALMVEKGYVQSMQQAFDEYLGETGCCHVQRGEPMLAEAAQRISRAGGLASLAHPCRLSRNLPELTEFVGEMRQTGLSAIEVYHSDHSPSEVAQYSRLAKDFGLLVTGGSDFHGAIKPDVELGTGRAGNLNVPHSILQDIRHSRHSPLL